MKKTIRIIAIAMIAVMLCGCLASCGKTLSGEYRTKEVMGSYTAYIFDGNKLTVNSYVLGNKVSEGSYEATYKIDGSEITITRGDKDNSVTETLTFEEFEDGSIKIGLVTLEKVEK